MSNAIRDGIFALHTRQFGRVVELLVQIIYQQIDSGDLSFDLLDGDTKIEVKGTRVAKLNKLDFTAENLYDSIVNNSNKNRIIKQSQINKYPFDCNIQQIKTAHFDELYYVLFFNDCIEIFKIESQDILTDTNLNYSDKQHRGNEGEGQFHVTNKNYDYHKKTYFVHCITYVKLKQTLLDKKNQAKAKKTKI